jgi:hypothetical protein
MLTLKTTPTGERIVMYGFKNHQQGVDKVYKGSEINFDDILFFGTREELLSEEEEWLRSVVAQKHGNPPLYYNYPLKGYSLVIGFDETHSILSAFSCLKENNYILIVKETNV